MWILAPPPGTEPAPPALEGKVLTTGPPGKSLNLYFSATEFVVICYGSNKKLTQLVWFILQSDNVWKNWKIGFLKGENWALGLWWAPVTFILSPDFLTFPFLFLSLSSWASLQSEKGRGRGGGNRM